MTTQEKSDEISSMHFDHSEAADTSAEKGYTDNQLLPDGLHRDFFESLPIFASLFGITFSYLAVFAAPLLVSIGLPVLEQTYGASPDAVFVPCSNTVGQCLSFLVVGRLSDFIGRRLFMIVGNGLSMIGYIVAARADTLATNIGGSFLFGVGAGVQLLAIMFALELVPFNRRYLTYAYILSAWGPVLSVAAGIVFTFVTTADDSWRWIAYFAFMTSFVSLVATMVLYHPQPVSDADHTAGGTGAGTKIDYLGTFLWAASTVSFLLGIYLGGQKFPWHSWRPIVAIVLGGCGWIITLSWELLTRSRYRSQVLPLLANRNYVALTLCVSFMSMCWTAPSMLWNQQIVAIYGGDALLAGWYYNMIFAGPALGQIISGVMATGFPLLQSQIVVAAVLCVAFGPALAAYTTTQLSMALVLVLVAGTGMGIAEIICVVGATSSAGLKEYGIAAGVLWTTRRVGTSIATAVYTTILKSKLQKNMLGMVVPILTKGGLTAQETETFLNLLLAGGSSTDILSAVPGVSPALVQSALLTARTAFADSFKVVYLTSIAFGVCALIAAVVVQQSSLDKRQTVLVARQMSPRPAGVSLFRWTFGQK